MSYLCFRRFVVNLGGHSFQLSNFWPSPGLALALTLARPSPGLAGPGPAGHGHGPASLALRPALALALAGLALALPALARPAWPWPWPGLPFLWPGLALALARQAWPGLLARNRQTKNPGFSTDPKSGIFLLFRRLQYGTGLSGQQMSL